MAQLSSAGMLTSADSTDMPLQAVKLQPDNVRALYRLASAQYSLQQLHQCVQTCTTALHVKLNAKQLQLLLCQAEESLRIGFLTNRHPEVICAVSMTAFTATQQVVMPCFSCQCMCGFICVMCSLSACHWHAACVARLEG